MDTRPLPTECSNCDGILLSWDVHKAARNGPQNGLLSLHDVQVEAVLGCDECSETLLVLDIEDALKVWGVNDRD